MSVFYSSWDSCASSLGDSGSFTWSGATLHVELTSNMKKWSSLSKEFRMSEEAEDRDSTDG